MFKKGVLMFILIKKLNKQSKINVMRSVKFEGFLKHKFKIYKKIRSENIINIFLKK